MNRSRPSPTADPTSRRTQQYGICLRGKAGLGREHGLYRHVVNTFGGRGSMRKWSRS